MILPDHVKEIGEYAFEVLVNKACFFGHKVETSGYATATCKQAGYTGDKVCVTCGIVIVKEESISKKAHQYVNGKCRVCCAIQPTNKISTRSRSEITKIVRSKSQYINIGVSVSVFKA